MTSVYCQRLKNNAYLAIAAQSVAHRTLDQEVLQTIRYLNAVGSNTTSNWLNPMVFSQSEVVLLSNLEKTKNVLENGR